MAENYVAVGLALLIAFSAFLLYCMKTPSEQVTLQQFCHELWVNEPMARWKWWVVLWLLVFKL